jgi:hypothetical protein
VKFFAKKDHLWVAAPRGRRHVARAACAKAGMGVPPMPNPAWCWAGEPVGPWHSIRPLCWSIVTNLFCFIGYRSAIRSYNTTTSQNKLIKRCYQKELDRRWSAMRLGHTRFFYRWLFPLLLPVRMLQFVKFSTHSVIKPIHRLCHQIDKLRTRNFEKKENNLYGEIEEEDGADCWTSGRRSPVPVRRLCGLPQHPGCGRRLPCFSWLAAFPFLIL